MDRIGPHEIIDRIGTGGMGTVYRARHVETGEDVALKVMRADVSDDPVFLRRFQREAQIARSLESEHIVRTVDAGVDGGTPWIAMELVEGESLASYLRRTGPLPADEALEIALQVASGLDVAHRHGVIHRDISPQNILITRDGVAKIADFGIARSQTTASLTATAAFVGKPAYAAPEVAEGRADIRSDIYSLGVVLFEMLSGRPLFVAPTPLATMDMHRSQPPPRLEDIGVRVAPNVAGALKRCLEKDPDDRYQTPQELIAALTGRQVASADDRVTVIAGPIDAGDTVAAPGRVPEATKKVTGRGTDGSATRWRIVAGVGAAAALAGLAVALVLLVPLGGTNGSTIQPLEASGPVRTGTELEPKAQLTTADEAAIAALAQKSIEVMPRNQWLSLYEDFTSEFQARCPQDEFIQSGIEAAREQGASLARIGFVRVEDVISDGRTATATIIGEVKGSFEYEVYAAFQKQEGQWKLAPADGTSGCQAFNRP